MMRSRGVSAQAYPAAASLIRGRHARSPRGFTFVELMITVGVMAIFLAMAVTGYKRIQSNFQAGGAYSRVESALNLARNLAVANNSVYHVRFETVDTVTLKPLDQPAISIYCFSRMADALGVKNESSPLVQNGWNPFATDTVTAYSTTAATTTTTTTTSVSRTHNNHLIMKTFLPAGTFYGIQWLDDAVAPYDRCLFFKPDGTASQGLVLFVTNHPSLSDDRSVAAGTYNALNLRRRKFFNDHIWTMTADEKGKGIPYLKMIQVFSGGLIKQRPPPGTGTPIASQL